MFSGCNSFPLVLFAVVRKIGSLSPVFVKLLLDQLASYSVNEYKILEMTGEPDTSFKTLLFGRHVMVVESMAHGDRASVFNFPGELSDTLTFSERVLGGCEINLGKKTFIALLLSESLLIYGDGEIVARAEIPVKEQPCCIGFSKGTKELLLGGSNGLHRVQVLS